MSLVLCPLIAPDLPYAPGWWLRYPPGPGYWDSESRLLPVAAVAGAEMWKSGGDNLNPGGLGFQFKGLILFYLFVTSFKV